MFDGLNGAIAGQLRIEVERESISSFEAGRQRGSRLHDQFTSGSSAERSMTRLGLLIGLLRAASERDSKCVETFTEAAERLGPDEIASLGAAALREAWENFTQTLLLDKFKDKPDSRSLIWNISSNRAVEFAVERSVPAIKADAARQLFTISCKDISWAILDSGIDASHPAFARADGNGSRIKATYDFGRIRNILNKANRLNAGLRRRTAVELAQDSGGDADKIDENLLRLANAMAREEPIDWTLVEPLIRRDGTPPVLHPHGTHVAGILAANWRDAVGGKSRLAGVCPDINLYDFRVLGPDMEQSEFAVIAALQFIRYLNERSTHSAIHGVNMSLSIPHNVRNYACGHTPVCVEAEKLVANGTVVVAAAGNYGFQRFRLADDTQFESYAASSITDPGNADRVITVGATHRYWPHTYGVSFFSSRGPTGDGRLKPDILAPGERIDSCVPGEAIDTMDGTSMAAPHVSGAAALLMGRHQELRGRPGRIKQILCETATDLGRERSFQGHGMIDVLRAIQSV